MKQIKTPLIIAIIILSCNTFSARAQSWSLTGNSGTASSNFLGTIDNKPLKFKTNDGLRMTIKQDGKIGIGTSSPDELLHIEGGKVKIEADLSTGNSTLRLNDPNGGNILMTFEEADIPQVWLGFDHSTDDFVISATEPGTRPDFIINAASAYVGLGTSTPSERLHVMGNEILDGDLIMASTLGKGDINFSTDQQEIGFTAPSNAFASPMLVMGGSSSFSRMLVAKGLGGDINTGIKFDYSDNQFDFTYIGDSKLSIDLSSGNVAIGSNAPSDRFEVHGGESSFYGNIGVQTAATSSYTIRCGSTQGALIGIGTAEYIQDAGSSTLSTANDWVPTTDNTWSLGSSSFRWQDVWAVDGSINTSDATMKTNIRDMNYGMDEIMKLRPVSFQWKNDQSYTKLGVIAQEIQTVLPEVVRDWDYVIDEKTGAKTKVASAKLGVMYDDIIPVLIKGIQEQQQQIEELKAEVESLRSEVGSNVIQSEAEGRKSEERISSENISSKESLLEQNIPNPASQTTTIRFSIPSNVGDAQLIITDMNGKTIQQFNHLTSGQSQVTVSTLNLTSGTYQYSLYMDGKKVDTKQMIITK